MPPCKQSPAASHPCSFLELHRATLCHAALRCAALQAAYRLQAVVNHSGASALCGHFTADVWDPASAAWYR